VALTRLSGQFIRSGSIPTSALGGGVVSSSAQVAAALPSNLVSSSAQVTSLLPTGTISASSQVSYSGLSNIPSGIVSSSTQIPSLLPNGTVSASSQVNGANITNNTVSYTAGAGLSGGGSATLGGGAVTINAVAGNGISVTAPTNDAINVNTGSAHFVTGSRGTISSTNTTGASGINLTYNVLTGIISGSLVNSSVTVNGSAISLGGSATVTANTTNALTLGNGLTGTSFNGSSAVTATVDTGSTHFTGGVTTRLNALAVVSSSAQIAINSTTGTLNVNKGGTGQTSYVNGQLLIGNTTGNTLTKATLTQGNGMTITNGAGSITLAIDTGSAHFTNGVTTRINALGVYSSSAQLVVSAYTNATDNRVITSTGAGGITGESNLTFDGSTLTVNGALNATTKSFYIDHQGLPGKKLVYGVLEGPEHAVYVRGKLTNNDVIYLPEEWSWLVDMDSITVQLTPIGGGQKLYVENILTNKVLIGNDNLFNKEINCYYLVHATRKDVPTLKTVVGS
jgi:hypothetical protein